MRRAVKNAPMCQRRAAQCPRFPRATQHKRGRRGRGSAGRFSDTHNRLRLRLLLLSRLLRRAADVTARDVRPAHRGPRSGRRGGTGLVRLASFRGRRSAQVQPAGGAKQRAHAVQRRGAAARVGRAGCEGHVLRDARVAHTEEPRNVCVSKSKRGSSAHRRAWKAEKHARVAQEERRGRRVHRNPKAVVHERPALTRRVRQDQRGGGEGDGSAGARVLAATARLQRAAEAGARRRGAGHVPWSAQVREDTGEERVWEVQNRERRRRKDRRQRSHAALVPPHSRGRH